MLMPAKMGMGQNIGGPIVKNPANGHYYQRFLNPTGVSDSWQTLKAYAESLGGYLATVTSQTEQDFIYSNFVADAPVVDNVDPGPISLLHTGGFKDTDGTWKWVSGEPFIYTNWNVQLGEPQNFQSVVAILRWYGGIDWHGMWGDDWFHYLGVKPAPYVAGFIVEWEANPEPQYYLVKTVDDNAIRSEFHGGIDIAVDSAGNKYVAGNGIHKYDPQGNKLAYWPFGSEPHGIAIGNGDEIFLCLRTAGQILVLDPSGNQKRVLNVGGLVRGIAVHPDGYLVITDDSAVRVRKFTFDGQLIGEFGTSGSGGGQMGISTYVAVDSVGDIYVSDWVQTCIHRYDKNGNYLLKIGTPGTSEGYLNGYLHIGIGNNDVLIVSNHGDFGRADATYRCRVSLFSKAGSFIGEFFDTTRSSLDSNFTNAYMDTDGSIWISNLGTSPGATGRLSVFKPVADLVVPSSEFQPSNASAWYTSNVAASISSSDSGSGVKEIHYSINMGAEQIVSASTATFTLSDNGTHSISYFAVDNAGNSETTQYATVKIDKIAPVTTLTRNAGLITLSATDQHSGVAKIKYQVNGGAVADYSGPFAETIHKVTYWAEDLAGNSEAAKTDIINAGVQSISVTQQQVTGGIGVIGTVTLDKAAGVGGTVVNLASSVPDVAVVDATVTVPEGATTATFDIDANPVSVATSVSITASIYETSQSALVNVLPPMPVQVTWSTSPVVGGTSTSGTLIISGPAPSGGTTVSLASSSLSALVGSSVTIPAGGMTTTFTVSTNVVSNDTSAVISATVYGAKLKSTLSILGPKVTSVSLASASIASTTTTTGTVTLSTNAPVGGKVVNLSSSNFAVASVPVSVTVAAGTRTATFTITAGTVNANTNATITATTNGSTGTATLTVTPPPAVLSNVATNVAAVTGGLAVTGTVTLTNPAPAGGAVVTLSSSSTTIGTVPASVTVAAGATSATFTITTSAVTAASSLTITGTRNGVSRSATITVNPVRVVSTLTLNPTSLKGGINSTGTVTLSGIATEAVVVTLTSGTTTVARVPASVTVPAGSTTATFTITTLTQTATRTSIITARTGTTSRTATLSVTR
jgi:hypothetical protein